MNRNEWNAVQALFSRFAADCVAPRHDLPTLETVPPDIWRAMGDRGLFKVGVGDGNGYLALTVAGESLVREGYNMGLALSWLYQQLIARFLLQKSGTGDQRKQYLEPMTRGNLVVSFAVSEPTRGAHPKHLSTRATKDGNGYILNGEKTYLTNGPMAGLYIVIAVTDDSGPRRGFTAFLLPRETAGLTVSSPMTVPFLKPAPHGGIQLSECPVSGGAVLGKEHSAYEDMVIPFGEIEDILMMGPAVGGMTGQLDMLCRMMHHRQSGNGSIPYADLGTLAATLETLQSMAYEAAGRLDGDETPSIPLIISFSDLAATFQSRMGEIVTRYDITPSDTYRHLTVDLTAPAAIRRRTLQIRREKLGRSLLKGPS